MRAHARCELRQTHHDPLDAALALHPPSCLHVIHSLYTPHRKPHRMMRRCTVTHLLVSRMTLHPPLSCFAGALSNTPPGAHTGASLSGRRHCFTSSRMLSGLPTRTTLRPRLPMPFTSAARQPVDRRAHADSEATPPGRAGPRWRRPPRPEAVFASTQPAFHPRGRSTCPDSRPAFAERTIIHRREVRAGRGGGRTGRENSNGRLSDSGC